jgi:O-antigen/teichoic acid export membrane protein
MTGQTHSTTERDLIGAAASTLIGYTVVYVTFAVGARRYVPVPVPWATLVRASLAAAVMYVVLSFIPPRHGFITVGARAIAGLVIYCGLIAAIDANGRMFVKRGLQRLRAKLGR